MSTWLDLPSTWAEWTTWEYPAIPKTLMMDLVNEDYNISYNEENIDIKNSGSTVSDKILIGMNGQITFSKMIDNEVANYDSTSYIVMTKEFMQYITTQDTFTIKLKDLSTGNYKLFVNCRLNKTPNISISSSGNREDVSVDFEKCVQL